MIVRTVTRQGRALVRPVAVARAMSSSTTTTTTTTTPDAPPASSLPETDDASRPAAAGPGPGPKSRVVAWDPRKKTGVDTSVGDFLTSAKLQRRTNRLGSHVVNRYEPSNLVRNPPAPKDISLELLMAAQTHLGHKPSLWNPANSRYILGIRNDLHIIALEQTAMYLKRAARVVEEIAYRGGLVLFVGTRDGQRDITVRAAELASGCYVYDAWTPGTITNRDTILRQRPLQLLDHLDRPVDDMEAHLAKRRPIAPDLVVCLNPLENFVLLRECATAAVPTIGIIDTDADPSRVTYPVPANDDSLRSVGTIAGILARAAQLGNKRRLRDAAQGVITWQTPADVQRAYDDIAEDGPTLKPIEVPKNAARGVKPSPIEVRNFAKD